MVWFQKNFTLFFSSSRSKTQERKIPLINFYPFILLLFIISTLPLFLATNGDGREEMKDKGSITLLFQLQRLIIAFHLELVERHQIKLNQPENVKFANILNRIPTQQEFTMRVT